MSNSKITLDKLMLKNLFTNNHPQHTHTYVIKKQHLNLQTQLYQITQSPKKIPLFRIQSRSKSQHRTPSKEKIVQTKTNFKLQTEKIEPKRDILRVRSLRSQKDDLRKKNRSVEQTSTVMKQGRSKEKDGSKFNGTKNLKTYVHFIMGAEGTNYVVSADFSKLRRRDKKSKITIGEKKVLYLLQNVFTSLFQALLTQESGISEKIQENCLSYLQEHHKANLQLLFSIYYPKILHTKLRPYLIFQRQLIYLICFLHRNDLLNQMNSLQRQTIKILIKYTKECLVILMEPLLKIDTEVVTEINQTFILLKAIGEMQKKLVVIQKEMKRIFGRLGKELQEVESSLGSLMRAKQQWPLERLVQKEMELSWIFFKIPPIPFLPPSSSKPYTLVIQLTNTLIFYDKETKMLKYRPYIDIFLTRLKEYFEIVIFTTASYQYTQIIVQQIQKVGKYFDYCLHQSHLVLRQGKLVKDYGRIGRDIKTMVIVDQNKPVGREFQMNFLSISQWNGDKSDRALYKIANVLWELQLSKAEDVRIFLRDIDSNLQMIDQDEKEGEQQMV